MKKILTFLILLAASFLTGCMGEDNFHIYTITLSNNFNTINTVRIITKDNLKESLLSEYAKDMNNILKSVSDEFDSLSNPSSTISKINQNAGKEATKVSDEFILVLKEAIKASDASIVDGKALFDITISPVWNLWGFKDNYKTVVETIPSDEEITKALELVDYKKIIINEYEKTVFLEEEGMMIDMGGIGKGYAADKIKEYLISKNIEHGVIDIGSNINLLGSYYKNQEDDWTVYLKMPYIEEDQEAYEDLFYYGYVNVKETSVVTSGTYQKYIIDSNGNEYHHILDPRTGKPFDNNVISITVITSSSINADALSTTLLALGLEKGMAYVNSTEGIEAIYVVKENDEYGVYESQGISVTLNSNIGKYKNYNYQIRSKI